jgi:hypothetical protein
MEDDPVQGLYDGEALLERFKELLGDLYIDASRLEFISELGVGELSLVERGLYYAPTGGRVRSLIAAPGAYAPSAAPACSCGRSRLRHTPAASPCGVPVYHEAHPLPNLLLPTRHAWDSM